MAKAHPGFKAVQSSIAKRQGVSSERAGAILGAATRRASAAAKRANPRLKRVKGGDSHMESPYEVVGGDIRMRVGVAMPSLDNRIQVGKSFDSCKDGNKPGPRGDAVILKKSRAMATVQPEVEANQGNTMGPRGDAKHVYASQGEYK